MHALSYREQKEMRSNTSLSYADNQSQACLHFQHCLLKHNSSLCSGQDQSYYSVLSNKQLLWPFFQHQSPFQTVEVAVAICNEAQAIVQKVVIIKNYFLLTDCFSAFQIHLNKETGVKLFISKMKTVGRWQIKKLR